VGHLGHTFCCLYKQKVLLFAFCNTYDIDQDECPVQRRCSQMIEATTISSRRRSRMRRRRREGLQLQQKMTSDATSLCVMVASCNRIIEVQLRRVTNATRVASPKLHVGDQRCSADRLKFRIVNSPPFRKKFRKQSDVAILILVCSSSCESTDP